MRHLSNSLTFSQLGHIYGLTHSGNVLIRVLVRIWKLGAYLKLAIVKFWGMQIFKEDHNIQRFQP